MTSRVIEVPADIHQIVDRLFEVVDMTYPCNDCLPLADRLLALERLLDDVDLARLREADLIRHATECGKFDGDIS